MHAFDPPLAESDPEIARLLAEENRLEHDKIRLIASENYASRAVMEATGSLLTNKYSEGYAHKRYYEGQQVIDQVEELAIARLKGLFGSDHVNVQPYSGSPANLAVYLAFCQPGDVVMGMALPAGGHLTHGHNVSITGKYFKSVQYGVRREDHRIDLDQVRDLARQGPRPTRECSISPRFAPLPTKWGRSSSWTWRTSPDSCARGNTPPPSGSPTS
jgi:glycine hydroxymethyltransferase